MFEEIEDDILKILKEKTDYQDWQGRFEQGKLEITYVKIKKPSGQMKQTISPLKGKETRTHIYLKKLHRVQHREKN